MKNAEKFKEIFKEFATEVWAFPEKDFLTWLNAEYEEPTTKNNLGVDYISRQAVLDLIADYDLSMGQVVRGIHALPSVTLQPRKGHWISRWHAGHDLHFHVCSECNEEFSCDMETGIGIDDYSFCPNCGADMRGEEV